MSRIAASPRVRWTVLALAALATGALMQWSSTLGAPDEVVTPLRGGSAGAALDAATGAAPNAVADRVPGAAARRAAPGERITDGSALFAPQPRAGSDPTADPFAMQPVAAAAAPAAATPAAAPAPAPTAPPLPFTYLGRWTENGRTQVFLQHQGSNLTVAGPGPLTGDYDVRAIDEQSMELVYRPLKQVQRLALTRSGGDDAVAPTVSAATSAAGGATPEEGN